MTIHLVKLCVGADSIEELADWQASRLAAAKKAKQPQELYHRTFQSPKRRDDLLDGGSLYWVIKGVIQARQRVLDLREGTKDDGKPCCLIVLDHPITTVRPTPRRAFQGWRYLDPDDAPPDMKGGNAKAVGEMSPAMRKELAELGLL